MSLMIDIGNTKTKYAHFVDGLIKEKGSCKPEDISKIVYDYSGKVKNMMLSSVKPIPDAVISKSKGYNPNLVVFSSEMKMPYKTLYETPNTLGTDRLALVAGAVHDFPKKRVLIIDAGTCITFDFVDEKKRYHGGSISPGLKMRLRALNNQTSALPLVDISEPKDLIGNTTKESIL